jgi:hypothetical protein
MKWGEIIDKHAERRFNNKAVEFLYWSPASIMGRVIKEKATPRRFQKKKTRKISWERKER